MIDYVSVEGGYVLLADDTVLPITNFFDEDGDDCGCEDAVTIVAGSDAYGWLTVEADLSDMARRLH